MAGTTNGVIETATGDLLRAGSVDFENDGSFNETTETYKTDVPVPPKVRKAGASGNHDRWNGTAWVEVAQPAAEPRTVLLDPILISALPPPVRGCLAYVTDDVGGEVVVFCDGTDWRRVTDRIVASRT
jgi:hypothetical protein